MNFCSTHRYQRATHQCDGCALFLCERCYETGHKLDFCNHCGERAVAIVAPEAIAGSAAARASAYGLGDALAYPFRGVGVYLFLTYVVLLFLFDLLASASLVAGLALMAPRLLIAVSIPGLLFAIVRSTVAGDDELPDWPDWSDVGRVLGDLFGFLLSILVSIAPVAVWAYLTFGDTRNFGTLLGLGLALFLGALLFIPAFGVVGVYESAFAALRVDLHLVLLTRIGGAVAGLALVLAGLSLCGALLRVVFAFWTPLAGALMATALGAYTLFLTPHLIGLLFRREADETRAVYG